MTEFDAEKNLTAAEAKWLKDAQAREFERLNHLAIELGFALQDPLGVDGIELARALIRLGRRVPAGNRLAVATLLDAMPVAVAVVEMSRPPKSKYMREVVEIEKRKKDARKGEKNAG